MSPDWCSLDEIAWLLEGPELRLDLPSNAECEVSDVDEASDEEVDAEGKQLDAVVVAELGISPNE
jgi:hypothetical protein